MKIILALICLLLTSQCALSCQCETNVNIDFLIENSSNIEIAQVLEAKIVGDRVLAKLGDVEVIKGHNIGFISTPLSTAACGVRISVGYEYVIFSKKNGATVRCAGTTLLGDPGSLPFIKRFFQIIQQRKEKIEKKVRSATTVLDSKGDVIEY